MKLIVKLPVCLLIIYLANTCCAQGPIVWEFTTASTASNKTTLLINATLAPGWHLFSQRIKQGGPMPTHFSFDDEGDYIPVGVTKESGAATVFYHDNYEMEITWYTGTVSFSQHFNLGKPDVTIKGKVEYMTCNDHVCIPGERRFSIDVSQ